MSHSTSATQSTTEETELAIDQILQGHTQSLHQALRLLNKHDPSAQREASSGNLDARELCQLIEAEPPKGDKLLLSGLLKRHHKRQLISELRSALPFVDLLISQLWGQSRPHPAVRQHACQFSQLLGARLLQRPDIAINTDHPLTRLIAELYAHLSIWEPGSGRGARTFPDWLQHLNQQLPLLDINSSGDVLRLRKSFDQYRDRELERTHKFEQRLVQNESSSADLERVRGTVVDFVGRRLGGQWLPEDISAFIQTQLIGDLQYLLIHEGVGCPTWKKWQRLLQVLSWAFAPDNSPAHRKKVMTLLPPQIEQLDDAYWASFTAPEKYEPFIEQLHNAFVRVLQALPLELETFPQLTRSASDGAARLEVGGQKDLSHDCGDWFVFQGLEQQRLVGKLLLNAPQKDLLLFTNYAGKTLAKYSFEEFSLAQASKVIRPLKLAHLYPNCLRATWQHLNNRHLYNLKIKQRIEETYARREAADKAQQEAKAIAQRQPPPAKQRDVPINADHQMQLQHSLKALHVGAWLAITNGSGQPQHVKLSVKLQAADKYIFTDRLGQRTAEYKMANLVELMANQQLKILSRGENFDSSLEKVVRGLRKTPHE